MNKPIIYLATETTKFSATSPKYYNETQYNKANVSFAKKYSTHGTQN